MNTETLSQIIGEGYDPTPVREWADNIGVTIETPEDWEEQRGEYEDAFNGHWDSELDFTYNLVDDAGMLHGASSELVSRYFDYEAFRRDLFMSDYYSIDTGSGGVWVFRNV